MFSRVIVGISGYILVEEIPPVYGVVLYGENICSFSQVAKLNLELKKQGIRSFVDQEGGMVARLCAAKGFYQGRAAHHLQHVEKSVWKKDFCRQAEQLKNLHFYSTFAPCVDLSYGGYIQSRSFGSDPERVTEIAELYLESLQQYGIIGVLKHFPGHGSSSGDTHKGLVDVTETFTEQELVPYQRLIAEQKVDAIMVSHVIHKKIDPKLPCSLSKKLIQGFLRQELGFKGTIITDDLSMGAIAMPIEKAIDLALEAGADYVIAKDALRALLPGVEGAGRRYV